MKITIIFKLVFLAQIAFSSSTSSTCQKWFLDSTIAATSRSCYVDCSLLDTDMLTFTCPNQCDTLCSKINCDNPPAGQCLYYSQCLEDKMKCGANGYAKGYGEKYCLKFLENEKLSANGKTWRNLTMSCLQQSLSDYFKSKNNLSCQKISEVGFESHIACYTQASNSICDLAFSDWKIIAWDIIDFDDLVSPNGIKQAAKVAFLHCLPSLIKRLDSIKNTRNSVNNSTQIDELTELNNKIEFLNLLDKK